MQLAMLQEVCTNSMKQWTNRCILDSLKGVVHTEFLSEAMVLAMALAYSTMNGECPFLSNGGTAK